MTTNKRPATYTSIAVTHRTRRLLADVEERLRAEWGRSVTMDEVAAYLANYYLSLAPISAVRQKGGGL